MSQDLARDIISKGITGVATKQYQPQPHSAGVKSVPTAKRPLFKVTESGFSRPDLMSPIPRSVVVENGISTVTLPDGRQYRIDASGRPVISERSLTSKETQAVRGGSFEDTKKEVDHIVPIGLGGTDDPGNLMALKDKKTIDQTVLDFITGKKRLPGEYKPKNRQEGKMIVEWEAIERYRAGDISLFEAMAAVQHYDNKELVNDFLGKEFYKIKKSKEPKKKKRLIGTEAGDITKKFISDQLKKSRKEGILNDLMGFIGGKRFIDKKDGEVMIFQVGEGMDVDASIIQRELSEGIAAQTPYKTPFIAETPRRQALLVGTAPIRFIPAELSRFLFTIGLEITGSDARFTPETELQELLMGKSDFVRLSESEDLYGALSGFVEQKLEDNGVSADKAHFAGISSAIMLGIVFENPFLSTSFKPTKEALERTLKESLEREIGFELSEKTLKEISAEADRIMKLETPEAKFQVTREFIDSIKSRDISEVSTGKVAVRPTEAVERVVPVEKVVTKEDILAQEARKYGSAEEFIEAKKYKGPTDVDLESIADETATVADQYGRELTKDKIEDELSDLKSELDYIDTYQKNIDEDGYVEVLGVEYDDINELISSLEGDVAELNSLLSELSEAARNGQVGAVMDWLGKNESWIGEGYLEIEDALLANVKTNGSLWEAIITSENTEPLLDFLERLVISHERHSQTHYDSISKSGLLEAEVSSLRKEVNSAVRDRIDLQSILPVEKTKSQLTDIWKKIQEAPAKETTDPLTKVKADISIKETRKDIRSLKKIQSGEITKALKENEGLANEILLNTAKLDVLQEKAARVELFEGLTKGIKNSGIMRKEGTISDVLNEGWLLKRGDRYVAVPPKDVNSFLDRNYKKVESIDSLATINGFESIDDFLEYVQEVDGELSALKKVPKEEKRAREFLLKNDKEYATRETNITKLKEQLRKQEKVVAKADEGATEIDLSTFRKVPEVVPVKDLVKAEVISKADVPKILKERADKVKDYMKSWSETDGVARDLDIREVLPTLKPYTPERHIPDELAKEVTEFVEDIETPIEFALGIKNKQESQIKYGVREIADRLNAAPKLTEKDYTDLFNAVDDPDNYKMTARLKKELGDDFLELHGKTQGFLTKEQVDKGVLQFLYNDNKYLRTIMETVDGGRPTAKQLAEVKIADANNLRDMLNFHNKIPGARFSTKNYDDVAREFKTADLRDEYLKRFGLQTKRNYVVSLATKVNTVHKLTANKAFNDALRALSKNGVAIKEAFDPTSLFRFREKLINSMRGTRAEILTDLRKAKAIEDDMYKAVKRDTTDFANLQKEDLSGFKMQFNKEISKYFDELRNTLKANKVVLTDSAKQQIEETKARYQLELSNEHIRITREVAKLEEEGFQRAGKISPEFRGIMVKERDLKALKEIEKDIGVSSLEDFARTIKLFQATLDLYQLPQALRSSTKASGLLRGSMQWLKAVSGVARKEVDIADILEHSKYGQQGRHVDFDIDIWKKFSGSLAGDQSKLMDFFGKIGKVTEKKKLINDVVGIIQKGVSGLEKYQWETVMIPMKVSAWKTKVEEMKRVFPNLSEREIKIEAGRFVDDYFQGQDWSKLMARNPAIFGKQAQRAGRISIFATDYLTSSLRVAKREYLDVFKGGIKGRMARQATARGLVYGLGTVQAISFALNGHSTFENDDPNSWYKIQLPWKDEKENPYYLDILGNWGQSWKLLDSPKKFLQGKISGIGRLGLSIGSEYGLDWSGFNPLPFNVRDTLNRAIRDLAKVEGSTYGVPSDMSTALKIHLLEFFGVSGTFSGGTAKTATMRKIADDVFTGDTESTLDNLVNWFLGKEMKSETSSMEKLLKSGKLDEMKDRMDAGETSVKSAQKALKESLGVSGNIQDNYGSLTGDAGELLIKTYSQATQESYLVWKTARELVDLESTNKSLSKQGWESFVSENPELKNRLNKEISDIRLEITDEEKAIRRLDLKERAERVSTELNSLGTKEEKRVRWNDWDEKGIITSGVKKLLEVSDDYTVKIK